MIRIVGHIDMDAFFASVEERDKPYLRGLPVIIGADPKGGSGRGVVSTANYKARELGIHSALPIQSAWKRCEAARRGGGARCVFITGNHHRYTSVSKEVFSIVRAHIPIVSETSIDEAYMDLSFCETYDTAKALATSLKRTLKKETNLSCSIGIGANKMIAKIASDYEKPNGLTVVRPEETEAFLAPLPIRAIPGIGVVAEQRCNRQGIYTVADAQQISWQDAESLFGKHGFSLWERFRGIDERKIETAPPTRKSIGKHHTFAVDTEDMEYVIRVLRNQTEQIVHEVARRGFTEFRTVVLTVRFADFTTTTRSLTAEMPLTTSKDIMLKLMKLVLPFFDSSGNPKHKAIRLIGVRVEKLV